MDWARTIDAHGLASYCQRCGAKGKFFPRSQGNRYRLREVRCARTLSDGETVCGGRLRKRPNDAVAREWPRHAIPYSVPQLDLFPGRNHGR